MKIQKVKKESWVLRLTPLLSGKARTVCTDLGPTTDYGGVKKAILEHYNVNSERCRKRFRAHTWTKDQEPAEWVAKGMKLAWRWLLPEEGVDKLVNRVAVEQFLNGLPQEMRIWVTSHSPETPDKVAELPMILPTLAQLPAERKHDSSETVNTSQGTTCRVLINRREMVNLLQRLRRGSH